MGSDESHFNVSAGSDGQSHNWDSIHKPQPFWRERRAGEAVSPNRGPSAYQPNAWPLGQTGSLSHQSWWWCQWWWSKRTHGTIYTVSSIPQTQSAMRIRKRNPALCRQFLSGGARPASHSRYEMANKPKIQQQQQKMYVGREGEKQTNKLSEKKKGRHGKCHWASNVSDTEKLVWYRFTGEGRNACRPGRISSACFNLEFRARSLIPSPCSSECTKA